VHQCIIWGTLKPCIIFTFAVPWICVRNTLAQNLRIRTWESSNCGCHRLIITNLILSICKMPYVLLKSSRIEKKRSTFIVKRAMDGLLQSLCVGWYTQTEIEPQRYAAVWVYMESIAYWTVMHINLVSHSLFTGFWSISLPIIIRLMWVITRFNYL